MSKNITDSTGVDIEVFTAIELEEQRVAAVEEYKAANPDKSDEVSRLMGELETANAEVEKFKGKDLNFSNLRQQKESAEKKLTDLKDEIERKIGAVKKEILDGVLKDHYTETLNGLAGDDAELRKKVELHYNRLQDVAATKEEVNKKLRDAWTLATKKEDDVLTTSVLSSGGVSNIQAKVGGKKFSPEEKEFGKKLAQAGGLTLEDKDFER